MLSAFAFDSPTMLGAEVATVIVASPNLRDLISIVTVSLHDGVIGVIILLALHFGQNVISLSVDVLRDGMFVMQIVGVHFLGHRFVAIFRILGVQHQIFKA